MDLYRDTVDGAVDTSVIPSVFNVYILRSANLFGSFLGDQLSGTMDIHFTQTEVYFSEWKVELNDVTLSEEGLKFHQIQLYMGPDMSRFNITIPRTDIVECFFTIQPRGGYIQAKIDTEPSSRIIDALKIPVSEDESR